MIIAFSRTIILYFLIMIGLRLMGKRQIGELEPGELVLTMMISDLAAVPMQDFGIPLLSGIIPIITLLSLSMLLSQLSLNSLRFRAILCGEPALLIADGVVQQTAMKKNRYTVDELLEELRKQGISSIEEVKYAILENSGHLSVLPWTRDKAPTAAQLNLKLKEDVELPDVLINDGRIIDRHLQNSGKDRAWLNRELQKRKIERVRDVFLLTVDGHGNVFCIKKEKQVKQ